MKYVYQIFLFFSISGSPMAKRHLFSKALVGMHPYIVLVFCFVFFYQLPQDEAFALGTALV